MGRQANGNVYCNDGWTDSIVEYDFMVKCPNTSGNHCYYYSSNCKYLDNMDLLGSKKKIALAKISEELKSIESFSLHDNSSLVKNLEISLTIDKGRLLGNYMNYMCNCTKVDEILDRYIKDEYTVNKITSCSEGFILSGNKCITHTENCKNYYGENVYGIKSENNNSSCFCSVDYEWNPNQTFCVKKIIDIPEGAIIRADNDIDVYIIKYVGSKKFKRLVLSPSVFNNYGHLKWENLMVVSQATVNSFITSDLVRAVGDDKMYRLYPQGDTGQKRLIKDNSVLAKYALDPDSIYEINSFDRDSYITGAVLE